MVRKREEIVGLMLLKRVVEGLVRRCGWLTLRGRLLLLLKIEAHSHILILWWALRIRGASVLLR